MSKDFAEQILFCFFLFLFFFSNFFCTFPTPDAVWAASVRVCVCVGEPMLKY